MSKVFLIAPHDRIDVRKATDHGDIIVLFPDHNDRPTFWDPELIEEALDRMWDHGYDVEKDHLIVAGHMNTVVRLACALVREHPHAKGLFWDAIERRYASLYLTGYTDDESEVSGDLQTSEGNSRGVRPSRRRAS